MKVAQQEKIKMQERAKRFGLLSADEEEEKKKRRGERFHTASNVKSFI